MDAIIIGHGYTANHLLNALHKLDATIEIYSRRAKPTNFPVQQHFLDLDERTHSKIPADGKVIFYTVPPQPIGSKDQRILSFLYRLQGTPKTIVYFSSSFVYGDHEGEWIDETVKPKPENDRAFRRLDAEKQLTHYCKAQNVNLSLLRAAGIYGPNKIPLKRVFDKKSVVQTDDAPYSNHTHVADLAAAAILCAQHSSGVETYNVSDGDPQPMGTMQRVIAEKLEIALPNKAFLEVFKSANPQYRDFLTQSKRLKNSKLLALGLTLQYPHLKAGVLAALAERNIEETV